MSWGLKAASTMPSTIAEQTNGGTSQKIEVYSQESTLETLASQVQENAKTVSDFLRSSGHAAPSFASDAPATSIPASAPPEIGAARQALMGAALQIFHLAAGPSEYLPHLAVGVSKSTVIHHTTASAAKWTFTVYSISILRASDGSPISKSSSWSLVTRSFLIPPLQRQREFRSNSSRL